jgi:hypothetical protein
MIKHIIEPLRVRRQAAVSSAQMLVLNHGVKYCLGGMMSGQFEYCKSYWVSVVNTFCDCTMCRIRREKTTATYDLRVDKRYKFPMLLLNH